MRGKPKLILGGPGCGKTTALLEVIEQAFSRGVEPHRIAYVAFTRKAAQEARDRMSTKFGIKPDAIPYFRTLHSLAFQRLDVTPDMMLTPERFAEFADAEHLDFNPQIFDEFGAIVGQPQTRDEKALAAIQLSRIKRVPYTDLDLDEDLTIAHIEDLHALIERFKDAAILIDYTDLLEQFVTSGACPELDLLIVDEAQDLSALQWEMVERLSEHATDVYYAGDDDQAIYEWAGADVPYFLTLDAERTVLPVSHRLKEQVYAVCEAIIGRVDARYPKTWSPHAAGGSVELIGSLDHVDLSKGTWFLLARTRYHVRRIIRYLREEGWPYIDEAGSSVDSEYVRAVLVWENLRRGRRVHGGAIKEMWPTIRATLRGPTFDFDGETDYGIDDLRDHFDLTADGPWFDVMTLPRTVADYIRAVKDRGESLIERPRITASTIHGVKGGEADGVVLLTDLTPRVHRAHLGVSDTEHRVWFTGASRAKEQLYFLVGRSYRQYQIEGVLH